MKCAYLKLNLSQLLNVIRQRNCSKLGVLGCTHNTAILDYLLDLSSI